MPKIFLSGEYAFKDRSGYQPAPKALARPYSYGGSVEPARFYQRERPNYKPHLINQSLTGLHYLKKSHQSAKSWFT